MRLLMINLLATAVLLVSAGAASAYQYSLVPTTPTEGAAGDIVSFDVFLDTQGDIGVVLASISLTYDPNVVQYRPDLSAANGYYPLYTAAVGKGGAPSWLVSSPNTIAPCGDQLNTMCDVAPGEWVGNLPPIGGQINIDYVTSNFPSGLTGSVDTFGTGTTVAQLATVSFELIGGAGTVSNGTFSFDNGGNVFSLEGIGDISETDAGLIAPGSSAVMTVIPEPTTALLVGLGLVGLGVAGRRRA